MTGDRNAMHWTGAVCYAVVAEVWARAETEADVPGFEL